MLHRQLTPALDDEVMYALRACALDGDTAANAERLDAVARKVCHEVHAQGMSPEELVVTVKALYYTMTNAAGIEPLRPRLQSAYDRLLASCLKGYFDTHPRRGPARH